MSQESISAGSTAMSCVLLLSLVMVARVPPFLRASGSLGSSHSMVGPAGQTEPCSKLLMSPDPTCSGNRPTLASVTTRTTGVRSPRNCLEVHNPNPSPGVSVYTQNCTNADRRKILTTSASLQSVESYVGILTSLSYWIYTATKILIHSTDCWPVRMFLFFRRAIKYVCLASGSNLVLYRRCAQVQDYQDPSHNVASQTSTRYYKLVQIWSKKKISTCTS